MDGSRTSVSTYSIAIQIANLRPVSRAAKKENAPEASRANCELLNDWLLGVSKSVPALYWLQQRELSPRPGAVDTTRLLARKKNRKAPKITTKR